jgi:hypothetical protein
MAYPHSLEKSKPDAVCLGYLAGKCSRGLATTRVGYSFKKDAIVGFADVAASHVKLFGAALELNTLPCAGDRRTVEAQSIP